jgi:hypothetical protein
MAGLGHPVTTAADAAVRQASATSRSDAAKVAEAKPADTIIRTAAAVVVEEKPVAASSAPKAASAVPVAASSAPALSVDEPSPRRRKVGYPRSESLAQRRSFVDITASGSFGHAEDYTWLRGEVEYSKLANGWRLRYASVDESDTYGGSVTLTGAVGKLTDGQHVYVRGQLHDPESRKPSPAYRVDSIEVVDKKD